MSVLKRDVPDGAVVEGMPAQEVAKTAELKRRMTPKRVDSAMRRMLSHFAEVVVRRRWGIAAEVSDDSVSFSCRMTNYTIHCVPSDGAEEPMGVTGSRVRRIFLVNRSDWSPPSQRGQCLIVDLTTMRVTRSGDAVYQSLLRFLSDYYGLKLSFPE
jgi:hypothetical protein